MKSIKFVLAFALLASTAHAEWATLSGQFIFGEDGVEIPKGGPITVTKDVQVCGKGDLLNRQLIVNEENRGLSNVMIWAYKPKDIHEDYKEEEEATVELNNVLCRFEPHVVAVRTGQTFRIGNPDEVGHNSQINFLKNPGVNPMIPTGGNVELVLKKSEIIPVKVSCSIHPWMQGIVLVQDHPYMAVTDQDGKFEIKNLPAGKKLTLKVWHEKAGYIQEVEIDGDKAKWKRGKYTLELGDGEDEEHTYVVDPKIFEK